MKKSIAVLLVLAMCLMLSACIIVLEQDKDSTQATTQAETTAEQTESTEAEDGFDPQTAAPLMGTWKRLVYYNTAQLGIEGEGTEFSVPVSFIFDDTGRYTIALDVEFFVSKMISFHLPLRVEEVYAEYDAQGITKEEADTIIMEEFAMSVEDYASTSVELMDFESLLTEKEFTGSYYVKDGKLYTDMETGWPVVYTIQIENDTLTFRDSDKPMNWGFANMPFPFVLAKAEEIS